MIDKMFQPAIPASYWIFESRRKCVSCGYEYICQYPSGNDVVKFQEEGGSDVRWLPTFELGGYLDLLERLIPEYSRANSITMPIVRRFESEFKVIQELSPRGNFYNLSVGCACPKCFSVKATIVSETTHHSPDLKWMKYLKPEFR